MMENSHDFESTYRTDDRIPWLFVSCRGILALIDLEVDQSKKRGYKAA